MFTHTLVSTRRNAQSAKKLKAFLLQEIREFDWLPAKMRFELYDLVNDTKINGDAIFQLWEIVILISEKMVDCRVDDNTFYRFTTGAYKSREWGEQR